MTDVEKFDVAAGFWGSHPCVGTVVEESRFALTNRVVVARGDAPSGKEASRSGTVESSASASRLPFSSRVRAFAFAVAGSDRNVKRVRVECAVGFEDEHYPGRGRGRAARSAQQKRTQKHRAQRVSRRETRRTGKGHRRASRTSEARVGRGSRVAPASSMVNAALACVAGRLGAR